MYARYTPSPHGRTRMIVFPLIRSVGFKAATASSRVETLPMFVRSRPSRTAGRSHSVGHDLTRQRSRPPGPSSGRASAGPTMDTSVPPARIRPADCFWIWGIAHIYFLIGVRTRLSVAINWALDPHA
jgi:hypothetical protein